MQMPAIQGRPPSLSNRWSWPVVAGLMFLAIMVIVGAAVSGLRDMAGSAVAAAGIAYRLRPGWAAEEATSA